MKRFSFIFSVALLLVGTFFSCGVDPVTPHNKYFVQNNTQDSIIVEYTLNPELNIYDANNASEQLFVAPGEKKQINYSKGSIDFPENPSRSFACLIVKDKNNSILFEQNPVEDSQWTCEQIKEEVEYVVISYWWTLSVSK